MSDKLIELESQISTLERTVDQLNEVIVDQGKLLETLQHQVERVTEQLQAAADAGDEPPPHY